jgi:hypothetical protein
MKKVKDYQHACEILGLDPESRPDNSRIRERDRKAFDSLFELTIIIEAKNKLDEFVLDWKEGNNQRKYSPWAWVEDDETKVSGSRLAYDGYGGTHSSTGVGSRLVLGSEESAKYIFEEHILKYEDWFLIPRV